MYYVRNYGSGDGLWSTYVPESQASRLERGRAGPGPGPVPHGCMRVWYRQAVRLYLPLRWLFFFFFLVFVFGNRQCMLAQFFCWETAGPALSAVWCLCLAGMCVCGVRGVKEKKKGREGMLCWDVYVECGMYTTHTLVR
ncbi:uncharacterized protein K452DRAFT_104378 [Aplosporella prunicola CBS 121167]|uniref:Uncharacterized protein n=1 Tax=Aplosporella prunicola CBS 121167 TaxID=1176127 RepID=A0A6A6BRS3_9PEZI|nr:uncharacterized protein K452DRAFT_104378 [Aplosporella prunicola CBS 121167]KAF2145985.1 hypothetical protein K452DRAFT_104378 [Aplosporella prunicola CBS 121167]